MMIFLSLRSSCTRAVIGISRQLPDGFIQVKKEKATVDGPFISQKGGQRC